MARAERGKVLAAVARDVRDLELAEDAVQEALLVAARTWPEQGVPARPGAWLTTVARRVAWKELHRRSPLMLDPELLEAASAVDAGEDDEFPDAQLELLFACCHPALRVPDQVALTLRTIGGLTTPEIARVFFVEEATVAQRIVRAQRRIRDSGIPFSVPPPERLPERLDGVLGVIHLVFTEGYDSRSTSEPIRVDLCDEAVRLAKLVAVLLPAEPEANGLAALVLAHDARREARRPSGADTVPLREQDRRLYDHRRLDEASRLLARAATANRPGRYQLQAAIALLHGQAKTFQETDWQQIALLYDRLVQADPSPAVVLGRAVAHGHANGPVAGLAVLADVEGLDDRRELHAVRGELLEAAGESVAAGDAYERALLLSESAGELRASEDLRARVARLAGA